MAKAGLPTIPPRLLEQVAARTDGVPLFVEEFTAMLLEAGTLRAAGGEAGATDTVPLHEIPATLQDLLLARLDRLASNIEVAQLAAAIGREFSYELLQAVAPWEEGVLREELAKLVEAELLFVRGRPPGTRYQFKHALIQDAAYQSLLKKKRQQFHVRIAEALEQRFPETCASQPELLAHHFTEGTLVARAVEYWARAGDRAQQRGAAVEAVGHFNRGLELVRTLPESRERHAQEIRLHIGLGVALAATRGFGVPELEATYARAHALCQQTGLTAQVFPALFGRLRYCMNRAMHAYAQELAEEILQLAEREANGGFLVAAHCALGLTLLWQGRPAEALPHLEKVIAVEATAELRLALHRFAPIDPWVTAHAFLSWALWLLGYPDRAAGHSHEALRIAEGLDHPFSLGCALCDAAWLHRFSDDREEVRATAERARRALALGTEKGFVGVIAWARILVGWTMAGPGQGEQALKEIRQGLEDLRAQAVLGDRNEMLPLLAEACARAGRPEEGLEALAEALEFADSTGETIFQAEVYRLKGELLLQHDPTAVAAAEACFRQAFELARRQQALSLELRAALSLARLWDRQGQHQAARDLLAPVYGAFTEGFRTHDLQTARALLEHCSSHRG
jgi:predicted ATPase